MQKSLWLLALLISIESVSASSSTSSNIFRNRWNRAGWLTRLEQGVEDYNAMIIAESKSLGDSLRRRRLICLPLNEKFDPAMGNFSHRHVQTGDKMSLPSCFGQAILINQAAVPFLFSVRRIEGVTGTSAEYNDTTDTISEYRPLQTATVAVGGPLDCRAPSCYVFLPLWMMRVVRQL